MCIHLVLCTHVYTVFTHIFAKLHENRLCFELVIAKPIKTKFVLI